MPEAGIGVKHWRRLILISGHRRGGTTWLNAVLGRAAEAGYMRYEAFMVRRHPESPVAERVQEWRRYPHWHVDWQGYGPLRGDHAEALREHLNFLVQHYFGGPVETLLVKDPFPGRLPFLIGALEPDAVIYVRRHPLGIVNSYDKGNLYSQWAVERDWVWFLQDLPGLLPAWIPVAQRARHPVERVALMAQASHRLYPQFLDGIACQEVSYEAACVRPKETFGALFEWLGWRWDETVWDQVRSIVEPPEEQVVDTFFSLTKVSEDRASGWRRELAPHLIRRVGRALRQVDAGVPMPGHGLPSLTLGEVKSSLRMYLLRRAAYRRGWGWRSVLASR